MVVVPSGKFLMGAGQGEIEAVTKDDPAGTERWRSNAPQISVVIAKAFAVGQTHVTRVQFKAFVDANSGYRIDSGCYSYEARQWRLSTNRSWRDPGYSVTDEQPVVCVNWNDAKAYAEWLSKVTGHGYRLLSDAETEYVTRAPKSEDPRQPRYFFGDDAKDLCAYANGADTTAADKFNWSATDIAACPDNFVFTAPVASFKPNRWGLYDVHGNVWTWTEDCWNDSNSGNGGDGTARATGDCSRHVIRGGSWYGNPRDLRAANRDGGSSENRVSFLGFRLAMTLNP